MAAVQSSNSWTRNSAHPQVTRIENLAPRSSNHTPYNREILEPAAQA